MYKMVDEFILTSAQFPQTALENNSVSYFRMADDEEVQALVVDNGSGMCKVLAP